MKQLLYLILVAVVTLTACREIQTPITIGKAYHAYWFETEWTYIFIDQEKFIFKCSGHIADDVQKGTYTIDGNIISLTSDSKLSGVEDLIQRRMIIVDNGCLKDFNNKHYCTDRERRQELAEREFQFEQEMIGLLDSLELVKKKRKEFDPTGELWQSGVEYDGIVMINKEEHHRFVLREVRSHPIQWISHLHFIVKKAPLTVYLHDTVTDSLREIEVK